MSDGFQVFEMIPAAPAARVIGPGRRERDYQRRIEFAARELGAAQERSEHLARELDVAQRIERGCQRHLDKLEGTLDDARARSERSEAAQKRLLLALGAVQRDNELLREKLVALEAATRALAAPARRIGLWTRLARALRA